MTSKTPADLRSARWFAPDDLRSFGHRSRMMQLGYAEDDFRDKPFIGILSTWSELNTCHAHFPERVKDVKRGVLASGGFPVEMPTLSVDESFTKPTSMLYRNLLAMETEEVIRSHPLDGVVLMGGCDKTTPGLIMGAVSAGVPMIYLPAGPMLRGNYAGKTLGSGSDAWKYWDERRAGNLSDDEWLGIQSGIARSAGTCMTMGTASTMTAIAEALGLSLAGASSIPAVDANHQRMSSETGRRIVQMVWDDLIPGKIITEGACRNAAIVAMATGCSTNAVVHLIAMARRAGVNLTLDDLDALGRTTPLIANVRPSGKDYLMEDFYYAGGLRALMHQLRERLDLQVMTVTGNLLGENLEGAQVYNDDVISPLSNPV
jgi:dihydroxyacid dehydratase/phosphogluconate dehydratase